MSEQKSVSVRAVPIAGVGIGVFWAVWGTKGFWWALLYGMFWPVAAGVRLSHWMGW